METLRIKSKRDGLNLAVAYSVPESEPVGIIQISHGMAEHKERYYDFMEYMTDKGYVCVINDHRGHGQSVKSKKDLGFFYTDNIEYIIDDLHQITEFIKEKFPGKDVFLFSHSMGTLVARGYIKEYDEEIKKLVLCGPPTQNDSIYFGLSLVKMSIWLKGDRYVNKRLNRIIFADYDMKDGVENSWVCSYSDTVKKYNEDPLCGFVFTNNGFLNLLSLYRNAFEKRGWKVKNKEMPIMLLAGKDDPVIQSEQKFKALAEFLNEIGYSDVTMKLYIGKRHELLNEDNKERVYEDIYNFL